MTDLETATIVKEIVLAVAAAVTAGAAVVGLRTWKKELKGKAEFEVARALARATYKMRNELEYFRSPFLMGHEFPEGDQESADAYRHLFQNRWKPVQEAGVAFDTCVLEAEALWGKSVRLKTDLLGQCVRKLSGAAEALLADKEAKGEEFEADPEYAKKTRAEVFGRASNLDNPLSKEIDQAVTAIEGFLGPHLARR